MPAADPYAQALSLLNRRAYSRRGIADKLKARGHAQEAITTTCDRLEAVGLLDDERFARQLIDELQRSKPAGSRLLQQKLYQRGIPSAVIQRLLSQHTVDDEALLDFALRKAQSMRDLDPATAARRLTALLLRRGFAPAAVFDVVQRVIERD